MKRNAKRFLSAVLAIAMVFSVTGILAYAAWDNGPTISLGVSELVDGKFSATITVGATAEGDPVKGYTLGVQYDPAQVTPDTDAGEYLNDDDETVGITFASADARFSTRNTNVQVTAAAKDDDGNTIFTVTAANGGTNGITYQGFSITYFFKVKPEMLSSGGTIGLKIANGMSGGNTPAFNIDGANDKTAVYPTEKNESALIIPKSSVWTTSPAAADGLVYGDGKDLITAGVADGGEAQYAVDGGTFSANVPKNTELTAGDHTVQYKIVGDSTHKDTVAEELTVTVAPAPIYPEDLADLAITPKEGLVYTGEEQDLLTITYKDKPVDADVYKDLGYTIVVNPEKAKDAKEAGYSVTYSIKPDTNHYYAVTDDTEAVSVEVELNKVTVKIARKEIDPKVDAMPEVTANNGVRANSANPLVNVDDSKSVKGVAVEFSVDGGERSATVPTATGVAAGTHYVAYYYIAADTTNYYLIGQDTELPAGIVDVTVAAGGGGLPISGGGGSGSSSGGAAASQTQTVTDEEGNTITTEKKADGSQVITFNTKDGTTGKFEINASGVLTAGEVKISDKALEEALKSGEPMSMPEGVKVPAATSQQTAAPIVITLPKFESAGKPVTELPKFKVELTEVLESIVGFFKNEGESEATLIRESVMGSLTVPLEGSCTLYIVNNAKSFTDVSAGQWFAKNVSYVTAREIFNGVSDNMFAPDSNMSRAMFAQVLYNFARGAQAGDGTVFTDVKAEQWFSDVAGWAKANGVFNGKADGSFGPDEDISRQDLITTLYRFAKANGFDVSATGELNFSDVADVETYAAEAMQWAVSAGLIGGYEDGLLRPAATATRAQVAAIMERFVQNLL